jgi:ATP-binding cassette subfamily B protein
VKSLQSTSHAVQRGPKPEPEAGAQGHIASTTSRFAYKTERLVLRERVVRSAAGRAGRDCRRDGAGKSTLISLLLRFYDVTSGRILVDGVDIREMDLGRCEDVRLVLQDVHLFSGTIAGNIRLGDDRSTTRGERAARAVHADRFIERCRAATSAGRRAGATLSVGRSSCCRSRGAGVRPAVLMLDEATSSVDTETELLIRDALHVLMAGDDDRDCPSPLDDPGHGQDSRVSTRAAARGRKPSAPARLRGIYYKLFELQYKKAPERFPWQRTTRKPLAA